jgi:hypothetical protein
MAKHHKCAIVCGGIPEVNTPIARIAKYEFDPLHGKT